MGFNWFMQIKQSKIFIDTVHFIAQLNIKYNFK